MLPVEMVSVVLSRFSGLLLPSREVFTYPAGRISKSYAVCGHAPWRQRWKLGILFPAHGAATFRVYYDEMRSLFLVAALAAPALAPAHPWPLKDPFTDLSSQCPSPKLPHGLAVDAAGNLSIADTGNSVPAQIPVGATNQFWL